MRLEWILELSAKSQAGEWQNGRHLGETVEKLQSTLSDLSTYVNTWNQQGLATDSPVWLKAVLRVERKWDGKLLGQSPAPTTAESKAPSRKSQTV